MSALGSDLKSDEIDKQISYREKILPCDQSRMKKQDEFTFSPVRETLEKQAKKLISRRKTNKKDCRTHKATSSY